MCVAASGSSPGCRFCLGGVESALQIHKFGRIAILSPSFLFSGWSRGCHRNPATQRLSRHGVFCGADAPRLDPVTSPRVTLEDRMTEEGKAPCQESPSFMNRPLSSSLWLLLAAALLVVALLPFERHAVANGAGFAGRCCRFQQTDHRFRHLCLDDLRLRLCRHRRLYSPPGVAQRRVFVEKQDRLAAGFVFSGDDWQCQYRGASGQADHRPGAAGAFLPNMAPIAYRSFPAMIGCSRVFLPAIPPLSARSSAPFQCWRHGCASSL